MHPTSTNVETKWLALASALSDTPDELLAAWRNAAPATTYDQLPPISVELEAQLWCYLEDLLSEDEEDRFLEQITHEPSALPHLQHIVRTLAEPISTDQLDNSISRGALAPGSDARSEPESDARAFRLIAPGKTFIVVLAKESLRRDSRQRGVEARQFTMARAGESEAVTTLEEEKLTTFGVVALTIDHMSESTCRVSFRIQNTNSDVSQMKVEWRDDRDRLREAQTPRKDRVRFLSVTFGLHHFVFLSGGSDSTELDRIVLDLKQE
ncbi:MAG: hypothetical protein ACKV2Q_07535 [Planctomycetaceae bacterium]